MYTYAKSVLNESNERLKQGEDLQDEDLPEGFEIIFRVPDPVFSVPEGLPIAKSEKHCAEILDSILASAVGLHFLETNGKPTEAVAKAAVKGHENFAELEPSQTATVNSEPWKDLIGE